MNNGKYFMTEKIFHNWISCDMTSYDVITEKYFMTEYYVIWRHMTCATKKCDWLTDWLTQWPRWVITRVAGKATKNELFGLKMCFQGYNIVIPRNWHPLLLPDVRQLLVVDVVRQHGRYIMVRQAVSLHSGLYLGQTVVWLWSVDTGEGRCCHWTALSCHWWPAWRASTFRGLLALAAASRPSVSSCGGACRPVICHLCYLSGDDYHLRLICQTLVDDETIMCRGVEVRLVHSPFHTEAGVGRDQFLLGNIHYPAPAPPCSVLRTRCAAGPGGRHCPGRWPSRLIDLLKLSVKLETVTCRPGFTILFCTTRNISSF